MYIPEDRVLYSGDAIVNRFIPNLEEGQQKEWTIWLESLEKIKQQHPEIVVPGHGEHLKSNKEILRELERIEDVINNAIIIGKAPTHKAAR